MTEIIRIFSRILLHFIRTTRGPRIFTNIFDNEIRPTILNVSSLVLGVRLISIYRATDCKQCPIGQYRQKPGYDSCQDCPPGKYLSTGMELPFHRKIDSNMILQGRKISSRWYLNGPLPCMEALTFPRNLRATRPQPCLFDDPSD